MISLKKEEMLARFKTDIAVMEQSIAFFERGEAEHGEVASGGRYMSLTDDLLEQYRETIHVLQRLIRDIEGKG